MVYLDCQKLQTQFYTADLNSHRKVLANSPSELLGSGVFFELVVGFVASVLESEAFVL